MINKKRNKSHSILLNNIKYKWNTNKESVGITLNIWKNGCIIVDEWFVTLSIKDITTERVQKIIRIEKL